MDITLNNFNNKFSAREIKQIKKEAGDFNLTIGNSREPKTRLGKDDFLKLLVVQMKHQDPLQPMKNTESIAQMAQFSALEQMVKVGKSMDEMAKANQRVEAQNLLGKQVTYYSAVKENYAAGLVNEIKYEEDGNARIYIGEEKVMLEDITGVQSSSISVDSMANQTKFKIAKTAYENN